MLMRRGDCIYYKQGEGCIDRYMMKYYDGTEYDIGSLTYFSWRLCGRDRRLHI